MEQIKVGDILYGMWHYSMHYPVWFKVTKVTAKQAQAVRLRSRMVQATDGGYGQQVYEAPDETSDMGDLCSRKKTHVIREGKYGLCTGSNYDYFKLNKWDGQPIWADHMD